MINNPIPATDKNTTPKKKPVLLRVEERDGREIAIYESGAEYDRTAKRLIKAPKQTQITPENATFYSRRRKEKAAALLRQRIIETHNGIMPTSVGSSSAAFAESGAMLYEQIVANSEAYPRDRMDAWEKLGKYADVLPSDLRNQATEQAAAITAAAVNVGAAQILAQLWADVRKAQADREVVDVEPGQVDE